MVEVVAVAVAAAGESAIASSGRMSCGSGKSVAADLVQDFLARPGKVAAKTAGQS